MLQWCLLRREPAFARVMYDCRRPHQLSETFVGHHDVRIPVRIVPLRGHHVKDRVSVAGDLQMGS